MHRTFQYVRELYKPTAFIPFGQITHRIIIQTPAQLPSSSISSKMSKRTKIAFSKYSAGPCASLSGDRLTTGGDGRAERDGK